MSLFAGLSPGLEIALGLDLGASRWRALWRTDTLHELEGESGDFESLQHLLAHIFTIMKCIPVSMNLAMPGTYAGGEFTFTNLAYPPVTKEGLLQEIFGDLDLATIEFDNDLKAAREGAVVIERSKLKQLRAGVPDPLRNLCTLTTSTGTNWSSGDAREGGHIRLGVPADETELIELIKYASERLGAPASAENLVGGAEGPEWIAKYLIDRDMNDGRHLSDRQRRLKHSLLTAMERAQRSENGCGRLMTEGALDGDPFWMEVAALWGKLLACFLHTIVTTDVVGELIIQGPLLNGTEDFAEWLFKMRPFKRLLFEPGMKMDKITRDLVIYLVPEGVKLGVIGAFTQASRRLSE